VTFGNGYFDWCSLALLGGWTFADGAGRGFHHATFFVLAEICAAVR
jgi:hypothetical protein